MSEQGQSLLHRWRGWYKIEKQKEEVEFFISRPLQGINSCYQTQCTRIISTFTHISNLVSSEDLLHLLKIPRLCLQLCRSWPQNLAMYSENNDQTEILHNPASVSCPSAPRRTRRNVPVGPIIFLAIRISCRPPILLFEQLIPGFTLFIFQIYLFSQNLIQWLTQPTMMRSRRNSSRNSKSPAIWWSAMMIQDSWRSSRSA